MTEEKEPRGFNKAKQKAESILESKDQLNGLISSAKEKAKEKQEKIKSVWNDFQTLLKLVQAWWKKEYEEVPWKTILYATSAILYFVMPLDFIPDFVPIAGFLDDITVITFVMRSLKKDIDKFAEWENAAKNEE